MSTEIVPPTAADDRFSGIFAALDAIDAALATAAATIAEIRDDEPVGGSCVPTPPRYRLAERPTGTGRGHLEDVQRAGQLLGDTSADNN